MLKCRVDRVLLQIMILVQKLCQLSTQQFNLTESVFLLLLKLLLFLFKLGVSLCKLSILVAKLRILLQNLSNVIIVVSIILIRSLSLVASPITIIAFGFLDKRGITLSGSVNSAEVLVEILLTREALTRVSLAV